MCLSLLHTLQTNLLSQGQFTPSCWMKSTRRQYFKDLESLIFSISEQVVMVKTMSSRKISLTTIVIMVITVVIMTISSPIFPDTTTTATTTTAPVAFGQRTVIDSEQSVTVTTTGIGQNNNNNNTATSAHTNTSSLAVTQSPENVLDVDCEGDLLCEILDNNTLVATTNVGESTTNTTITSALDTLNQSLAQSLNQSSILPLPFGENNDFNNLLNDDFDIFNEHEDLDSEIDEWVDRMLNGTLGDLGAPLQPSPDLLPVSV